MKLLIVMGGFFPGEKYGGPPVSVDNFCSLMREHSCYIVTRNHDLGESKVYDNIVDGWNERGNCKVKYLPDSEYNMKTFSKIIREVCPDVMYLQGLFQSCVLPCLYLCRKHGVRVVLAPRGELCEGAIKIKKYKKIPYILFLRMVKLTKNVVFQSTSNEETEAIHHYLKACYEKIYLLTNIPSIPSKQCVREEKCPGLGRFVFLSRIHPKKNLLSAIRWLKDIKGQVVFDIYGPIEDQEYWEKCQKAVDELPKNVLVTYKGLVSHNEVHETFSKYDAFLFPTLSENYGHVIAESLMVGTPVIISDQTPWTDITKHGAGFAHALSDELEFCKAIQRIVDLSCLEFDEIRGNVQEYTRSKLQLDKLKKSYSEVFQCVYEE